MDPHLPEGEIMDKGSMSYSLPKERVIVNQFLYSYHLLQTHSAAPKIWCHLLLGKRKA